MRKEFSKILHNEMGRDDRIYLLTGDLGYGLWDKIKIDYPDRFFNVGSSEQLMMGAASGLAADGKIPVVYSITPFLLYRPFEFIRNYVNHERLPVKLIGGGRGQDYGYLGFSHWAEDDKKFMKCFKNIKSFWPETIDEIEKIKQDFFYSAEPYYINLKR